MDSTFTITLTYGQLIKLLCDIVIIGMAAIMLTIRNSGTDNKQIRLLLVMIASLSGIVLAFSWFYTHIVVSILTTLICGVNIVSACVAVAARNDARPQDGNYMRAAVTTIVATAIMMIVHMF